MLRPLITPFSSRERLWKRAAVSTVIALLLLVIILPAALSQLIRYQVPKMGLGRVEIGNIDINLFRGKVVLEEVGLYKSAAQVFYLERGEIDLSVLSLLERRIHLQSLNIQGASLTLQQLDDGQLRVAGNSLPVAPSVEEQLGHEETAKPWAFGLDELNIRNSAVHLIHPKLTETIELPSLSVGALAMWRPDYVTPLKLNLGLREATLGLEAKSSPFSAEPLHKLEFNIASFPLGAFSGLAEPYLTGLEGKLSAQMQLQLRQLSKQKMVLQQEGQFSLLDLKLQYGDTQLKQQGLYWSGMLSWSDVLDLDALRLQGGIKLSGLELANTKEGSAAAVLKGLSLEGLKLTGRNAVSMETVSIDGLQVAVARSADGVSFSGLPTTTEVKGEAESEAQAVDVAEDDKQQGPFSWSISTLKLSGNNRIRFDDQTVKPAFTHSITVTEGVLQHIDNTKPKQPTSVSLKGKDDFYTKFVVEGEVSPFLAQPALNLKADLSNYDMPPASPYLAQLLGYRITTGVLDSQVSMKIENNEIDGEVAMKLHQLKLEPEDPARIEEVKSTTPLPLDTALSLLRDKNDNIELKLPISGNLDDPQFNINDIINTALGKALKTASVSYLKLLLQPYGSLISVIQLAGMASGGVQLDPVIFEPGASKPGAESTSYLQRIGELLQKKEVNLYLCGMANTADMLAITKSRAKSIPAEGHPELEALAKERAEAIKLLLVEAYSISPKRLFVCHPGLDRSEEGNSRVDLSIR